MYIMIGLVRYSPNLTLHLIFHFQLLVIKYPVIYVTLNKLN